MSGVDFTCKKCGAPFTLMAGSPGELCGKCGAASYVPQPPVKRRGSRQERRAKHAAKKKNR